MSTIHYFYWYPSEGIHYQFQSYWLWSCGGLHPRGHLWDSWCLQCSFLIHYPKAEVVESGLCGRHHQERQQLLWWFNNRWFKHRLFNSCEFHVCAAVAFPSPSHPSLLFPLKHCYPFLFIKRAETWDVVSRTSSLLPHSFGKTYPFASLAYFFT